MSKSNEFLQEFEPVLRNAGWRTTPSPVELVDQYRSFVQMCADGYSQSIYEYRNDRSVRDLLDRILRDPALSQFDEMDAIRESVEATDREFLKGCRVGVSMAAASAPWWQRCVPQKALGEFAEDLGLELRSDDTAHRLCAPPSTEV